MPERVEPLSPMACWDKAREEYPTDRNARRVRYVELMRENLHLVHGKAEPLPCGWPFKRAES